MNTEPHRSDHSPPGLGPTSLRVLVVEDDPDELLIISRSLRRSPGLELTAVASLAAAVAELDRSPRTGDDPGRRSPFDVILTDLGLPDSDGLHTYRALAAVSGDLPIVIITGNDEMELGVEALRSGAQDCVSKQLADYTELLDRILRFAVERHGMKRQLRRHEAALRQLMHHSGDAMLVLDEAGQPLVMNDGAQRLIDESRLCCDQLLPFISGRDGRTPSGAVRLHPGAHGASDPVSHDMSHDMSYEVFDVVVDQIAWLGCPAFLLRLRDVTDLAVAAEAARQGEQTLSHELRTPVASIVGYTEMLVDEDFGPLTDGQQSALAAIDRNGRRLLSLMNDLLTLTRIDHGTVDRVETGPVDPAVLIRDVRSMIEPLAASADIALRWPSVVPSVAVTGHRGQLEQVMSNLLTNAIKFSRPNGTVDIDIEHDPVNQELVLTVTDRGIGMNSSELARIFDRFYRADSSHENAVAGTGIGLSLSKALVEANRGRISADAVAGRGAVFTVALPASPRVG